MAVASDRPERICWVVTDGRAGIEAQAMALAEAIAARTPLEITRKRIRIRAPWRSLPRRFWGDAFARLAADSDDLAPPYPDLWIGCGRLSVPLTIAVKERSGATFTVQLQDPRAPVSLFDLVAPPEHDGLSGANVFPIVGSPSSRQAMHAAPDAAAVGERKMLAVLIGGPNRAFGMNGRDARALCSELRSLAGKGVDLAITTSRRTPAEVAEAIGAELGGLASTIWRADVDNAAANPYPAMLARADAILVTEDSVNMAVEAAATGKPVYIRRLRRKPFASSRKFDAFHESLARRGATRYFEGALEHWAYAPLDETGRLADEIVMRWSKAKKA